MKEDKTEVLSRDTKIMRLMEEQFNLLSYKSQCTDSITELVEMSNQMVNIAHFLIHNHWLY